MEAFIEKFSRKYNLPAADCLRLIGLMERRVFCKGECVVRQGERNSDFYVVSRGIWLGHYLDDGADVSVWFAGEGEALFSTWGYVGNEVSKISIEAMCDAEHLQSRPGGLFRPIGRSGQFREEAFRGAVPGARKLDALGRRSAGRGALSDADGGKPRTAAIRAAEAHRLLPLDHAAVVEPHPGQTGEEKGLTITVNPFFRHPTAATRPRGLCTTPRARGARCAPPCSPRPVRRRTSAGRRARRCSGSRR